MSAEVTLTAALRSNLLSLQGTQRLLDQTQLRLATGLKVNSALDNPGSYFAAQALNNRAGDLSRLLDGMGQAVQVLKSADQGIKSATSLLEQAQAVAQNVKDTLAADSAADVTALETSYNNYRPAAQGTHRGFRLPRHQPAGRRRGADGHLQRGDDSLLSDYHGL
jgi:flagellin